LFNILQECLLGGGLSGSLGLTLRLAEAAGYTPLLITFKDIEASMKSVTRSVVHWLRMPGFSAAV
jgi:hypothetical protein